MKKNQVSKSQFKPRALEYFRKVQETGRPLIITEYGKAVLKIIPYESSPDEILKSLRNTVVKYTDPAKPVSWKDWDALK